MDHFESIESTTALWQLRRAIATRTLGLDTETRFVVFRVRGATRRPRAA